MEECKKWLQDFLAGSKSIHCDTVRDEAKKRGFSRSQLKTARKSLGVSTFHQFDENGATPNWFWSLPESGRGC